MKREKVLGANVVAMRWSFWVNVVMIVFDTVSFLVSGNWAYVALAVCCLGVAYLAYRVGTWTKSVLADEASSSV